MRQINLFQQICKISTKHFFSYNNSLVFGVPRSQVSKAIGKDASNVKRLSQILRKKIKIIAMPSLDDNSGIIKFIEDLVSPVEISKIQITEDKMEINTNRINRASLIGRNRTREKELIKILKDAFSIRELRIA